MLVGRPYMSVYISSGEGGEEECFVEMGNGIWEVAVWHRAGFTAARGRSSIMRRLE
jgi:hypothetical protein